VPSQLIAPHTGKEALAVTSSLPLGPQTVADCPVQPEFVLLRWSWLEPGPPAARRPVPNTLNHCLQALSFPKGLDDQPPEG